MAARRSDAWKDILGRCGMAQMLIKDTSGRLDAMNASAGYSSVGGVEFTDEIKAAADALMQR